MHQRPEPGGPELAFLAELTRVSSRRTFLKWSGLTLGVTAIGCSNDTVGVDGGVSFGSGDTAVLNYAYVLEQLEAAFYDQVARTLYAGVTAAEQGALLDIRDHEAAHRDFLARTLGPDAVDRLEFDFTNLDFADRADVLATARTFEDLGVAAYNGAAALLTDPALVAALAGIVAVEARHASVIRDFLLPASAAGGFAGDDVVDANGLDRAMQPSDVLAAAAPFIPAVISSSLP
jgi:rubrerythrin